jgi:hypothetical protein
LSKNTRWQNQQEQARKAGYKNAWAMRKAQKQAALVSSNPETASIVGPPERFGNESSPIRHLMKDGEWLVPQNQRPRQYY